MYSEFLVVLKLTWAWECLSICWITHNFKEDSMVFHELWWDCYGVQVLEQIAKPDIIHQLSECLELLWLTFSLLFSFSPLLRPAIEAVFEMLWDVFIDSFFSVLMVAIGVRVDIRAVLGQLVLVVLLVQRVTCEKVLRTIPLRVVLVQTHTSCFSHLVIPRRTHVLCLSKHHRSLLGYLSLHVYQNLRQIWRCRCQSIHSLRWTQLGEPICETKTISNQKIWSNL